MINYDHETQDEDDFDFHGSDLWNIYAKHAENHDSTLITTWKTDMDAVILFAGLYSASLVALLVESTKNLQPDESVVLLAQISSQLQSGGASPTPTFQPTSSDIRINICWSISLVFSLSAALAATVVQRWVRDYISVFHRYHVPLQRARACQYLFEGAIRWKLVAVVNGIPNIIHISLFLFFFGLCDYMYHLNANVGIATITAVTICGSLYLFGSIAPFVNLQSPYQTPLTDIFWWIHGSLAPHIRKRKPQLILPNILDSRVNFSMDGKDFKRRLERDGDAIAWTINNITKMDDFEDFLESIPGSFETAWGKQVWTSLSKASHSPTEDDPLHPSRVHGAMNLIRRGIDHLLRTCVDPGLDDSRRIQRTRVCTNALLAFTLGLDDISWFPDTGLVGQGLTYLAQASHYSEDLSSFKGLHHHTNSAVKWVCLMIITLHRVLSQNDVSDCAKTVFFASVDSRLQTIINENLSNSRRRNPEEQLKDLLQLSDDHCHTLQSLDNSMIKLTSAIMRRTSGLLVFVPRLTISNPLDKAGPVHEQWLFADLPPPSLLCAPLPQTKNIDTDAFWRTMISTIPKSVTEPFKLYTCRLYDISHSGGILFTFDVFLTCYEVPGIIPAQSLELLEATLMIVARQWAAPKTSNAQTYLMILLRHVLDMNPRPTRFILKPMAALVRRLFLDPQDRTADLTAVLDEYVRIYGEAARELISLGNAGYPPPNQSRIDH